MDKKGKETRRAVCTRGRDVNNINSYNNSFEIWMASLVDISQA